MAVGSCFMQVPPWGTGKDWSQLGLGNEQLQGWADQRTPITMGLCFMYTLILVGLCLPLGGNGVPPGSPCLGCGGCARDLEGAHLPLPSPRGWQGRLTPGLLRGTPSPCPDLGWDCASGGRQSREGKGVIPCDGAAGGTHTPEHPCKTAHSTSPSYLTPSCQGQHGGCTAGTPVGTAGRVCATVTASAWLPRCPHAWRGDTKGKH